MTAVDLETAIPKLLAYCRGNDWAGYDPYDALNSPFVSRVPLLDHRIPRLILTQLLKRSPVNCRGVLRIPRTHNAKAIALCLSALLILKRVQAGCDERDVAYMIERLRAMRSPGTDYWCWGYSFPWQTRTMVVPAGAPNLVCTSFVANALLDTFDECGNSQCLNMAVSAAEYIFKQLYWNEGGVAGFSYPLPSLRSQVHNANFLAASLLCRVHTYTNEEKFLHPALTAARYSVEKQNSDGSWYYGETPSQSWIDNFHTGYNLCALQAISEYVGTAEFSAAVRSGFEFYASHFIEQDGSVRYFHDRRYPMDIHCTAQSILTLLTLRQLCPNTAALAHSIFQWAMTHLWDERGFFYYRQLRSCTNRIPYMRWSQAWMLLAMARLLEYCKTARLSKSEPRRERVYGRQHA